jgi:TonB family protein
MVYRILVLVMTIAGCGFLTGCTHTGRALDDCLFLVGKDTVSLKLVNRLVPDSLSRPKKLFRAALELACARTSEAGSIDNNKAKKAGGDLARQLSRLSSDTWSEEAGADLYIAAKLLAGRALLANSITQAIAYADSIFSTQVVVRDSCVLCEFRNKKISAAKTAAIQNGVPRQGDPASLEPLFTLLLDLPPPSSRILGEFVSTAENEPTAALNVDAVIKGLVFDSARQQVKKALPGAVRRLAVVPDNSKEALKFRNSVSIKDSIGKHIPDLEALYKKHLKLNQNMEGTVLVTFHINPDGSVLNAQIQTSTITDRNFLIPFRDYVMKKIHFQRIPDNAGAMSVEFPFEFSPEH